MNLGISSKKALVLAASSGLGKSIAQALKLEGAAVAICSKDRARLKTTAFEIGADYWSTVDLTQPGSARALVEKIQKEFGDIDILVTNAGGPPSGGFTDLTTHQWHESFQSLWMSALDSIHAVVPAMKTKQWGRIIMITSIAAKEPANHLTLSNGLRAGLLGLMKSISNEIAKDGITLNAILPGYIATDRLKALNVDENKLALDIPAGRIGRPEELASLACFLASDQARHITGQSIAVDGGRIKGV